MESAAYLTGDVTSFHVKVSDVLLVRWQVGVIDDCSFGYFRDDDRLHRWGSGSFDRAGASRRGGRC